MLQTSKMLQANAAKAMRIDDHRLTPKLEWAYHMLKRSTQRMQIKSMHNQCTTNAQPMQIKSSITGYPYPTKRPPPPPLARGRRGAKFKRFKYHWLSDTYQYKCKPIANSRHAKAKPSLQHISKVFKFVRNELTRATNIEIATMM